MTPTIEVADVDETSAIVGAAGTFTDDPSGNPWVHMQVHAHLG